MGTTVKTLSGILKDKGAVDREWQLKAVINDDNMTYIAWNERTREALAVDPMREDWDTLVSIVEELRGYRWLAVVDTHTHADHVSVAAMLAERVGAPLIQHQLSPSRRIHIRISRDTAFPAQAAPVGFLVTPGHTQDSLTVIWGPFLFGGDTLMYGDTGRDDLPTGDAAAHFESLQKIKGVAGPELIMLPGHDGEGGRASTWATQLEVNAALRQTQEEFLADGGAYIGPSPRLLKESLFENFK